VRNIRIEQYDITADDKVSVGGIKWLKKWDVCIQCDSIEEAQKLRDTLLQKPWAGLTEEEVKDFQVNKFVGPNLIRAIERRLKEKNGG
jgi:hypothetical protein